MENKESRPGWYILVEGVIGYTVLITLGLITNFFSEEFAVMLAEFLVPMALFVGSAIVVHSIAKYVGRWSIEKGTKEVKE